MNDSAVQMQEPLRISEVHDFGVTPFGAFCFKCKSSVGKQDLSNLEKSIRTHVSRKKHEIGNEKSLTMIVSDIEHAISVRFSNVRNYDRWIRRKSVLIYTCSCGASSDKLGNMKRHKQAHEKSNPETIHIYSQTESVITVCNRKIEKSLLEKMNMDNNITVQDNNITVQDNLAQDTNNETCLYIPIKNDNRRWLTTKMKQVKSVFFKYKNPNETLDPYLSSLKLMMVNVEVPVIDNIRSNLSMIKGLDGGNNDPVLIFL